MDKNEIKQILVTVSFNKVKDLIENNKVDEAQAVAENLTAQLKEIDNLYSEDMSFKVGDLVTIDDPEARAIIELNNSRDASCLDNIYKITEIDSRYVYLRAVRSREEAVGFGMAITLHESREARRITKLVFRNPFIADRLEDKE